MAGNKFDDVEFMDGLPTAPEMPNVRRLQQLQQQLLQQQEEAKKSCPTEDPEKRATAGRKRPRPQEGEKEEGEEGGVTRTFAERVRHGEADDGIEVLSSGQMMRAPLPMQEVLKLEANSSCECGAYFVGLMRRRLISLLMLQCKWLNRKCNSKHRMHYEVQEKLRDYITDAINKFDQSFKYQQQQQQQQQNKSGVPMVAYVRSRQTKKCALL